MTQEEFAEVFHDATMQAVIYGVGLVKVQYVQGELEVSSVQREEFLPLSDHLKWIDENAVDMEKQ
jgi:hypothetical protein